MKEVVLSVYLSTTCNVTLKSKEKRRHKSFYGRLGRGIDRDRRKTCSNSIDHGPRCSYPANFYTFYPLFSKVLDDSVQSSTSINYIPQNVLTSNATGWLDDSDQICDVA